MRNLRQMLSKSYISSKLIRKFPNWSLRLSPSRSLSIEASCACNINCYSCPVGNRLIKGHNMELDDFCKILDLLPSHILKLDFSHRGDPTMNPNLAKMVQLAHKKGIITDVYTNGLFLDRHIDGLVESGLDILRVDLDGASQKSYLSYRVNSNYEKVKSNIRALVEARSKSKGKFPKKLLMICVVSAFNENEISDIQKMAEDLGVDEVLFKTMYINYGTKYYHDAATQKKIAPKNKAYRRAIRAKDFLCPFLWRGSILYNGDLQLCTCDFEGEYVLGNILKENSFEKVYYNQRANSLRKQVVNHTGSLCKACAVVGSNHYIPSINKKFVRQKI